MIRVEGVVKTFGARRALDAFTLEVAQGELFGLVGPNGAGKTTLMRVLSTLTVPEAGTATVGGFDVVREARAVKAIVGYLPDQPGVYQDMTVREFLEFFADAFHIKGAQHETAVAKALERSKLGDRADALVEQLSFGMKQRLVLAKTLLHEPKVLLLDEPATGLDPMARIELREQLKALQAQGITILLSSHILSDLEDICSQVAFIANGRNAQDAEGHSVLQLHATEQRGRGFELEFLGDAAAVSEVLESAGARVIERGEKRVTVEIGGGDEQAAAVLRAAVMAGVDVLRFNQREFGLEERYRKRFEEKRP